MNIRVTLNCSLITEKKEELILFLEENLANMRNFPGCISVDVLFDKDNQEMLLEEQWQSIPHHKEYINFISGSGILDSLCSFFEKPPMIKYFNKANL